MPDRTGSPFLQRIPQGRGCGTAAPRTPARSSSCHSGLGTKLQERQNLLSSTWLPLKNPPVQFCRVSPAARRSKVRTAPHQHDPRFPPSIPQHSRPPRGSSIPGDTRSRSRELLEQHSWSWECPLGPELPPLPAQALPGSLPNPLQGEGGEGRTGIFMALDTPDRSHLSLQLQRLLTSQTSWLVVWKPVKTRAMQDKPVQTRAN